MLPDGYSIRLARYDEVPLMADIERIAAENFAPYGLDKIMGESLEPLEMLQEGVRDGRLWVAVDANDHPIGFALAIILEGQPHLDELDVLPDHGKRGLGTALVETVCTWARKHGFKLITLSTMRNIPWNAPFYAKHDFRILAPDELSQALHNLIEEEIAAGLPAERVIMHRKL